MPCTHCKQIGHNKRTCAFISKEMVAEEVKEEMTLREKPLFLPTEMDGSSHPLMNYWVIDETDEEEDEKGEEEETDEEEVRKEEELYRKYGYDNEGTKLEKKKKAAPKKKKKGMKGAVELIMNQQKKAKKRKVVDIDTTGLKVDRSIADLLAGSGRMIDSKYIKEVGFGDDE